MFHAEEIVVGELPEAIGLYATETDPYQALLTEECWITLLVAIGNLTEQEEAIIMLVFRVGHDIEAIAQELRVAVSEIEILYTSAVAKLHTHFATRGLDGGEVCECGNNMNMSLLY